MRIAAWFERTLYDCCEGDGLWNGHRRVMAFLGVSNGPIPVDYSNLQSKLHDDQDGDGRRLHGKEMEERAEEGGAGWSRGSERQVGGGVGMRMDGLVD